MDRADVETAILDEESMLDQVARLLEGRCQLAGWPEDVRMAFAVALDDDAMTRTESWKALTLHRHLFGPTGMLAEQITGPAEPSPAERMRAERLRSGLPAIVRYRAGSYLLQG